MQHISSGEPMENLLAADGVEERSYTWHDLVASCVLFGFLILAVGIRSVWGLGELPSAMARVSTAVATVASHLLGHGPLPG